MSQDDEADIELEWEDWDGRSPFFHHCIAGSIAGVAEHTLLYPFDTIKTHMQAYCSTCPKNPANQSIHSKGGSSAQLDNTMMIAKRGMTSNPAATDGTMWTTMKSLTMKHGPSPVNNSNVILPNTATLERTRNSATILSTVSNMHIPSIQQASSSSSVHPTSNHTTTSPKHIISSASSSVETGFLRLWRGVQSMALGSAPAHALYFSSYEVVKAGFLSYQKQQIERQGHAYGAQDVTTLGPVGASVAGATATLLHDTIMCPMDTIKQRMQLGHYTSVYDAFVTIVKTSGEGWMGLYRSFGVTLLSNLPYGMIMFTTNEWLRGTLLQWKHGSDMIIKQQQQQHLDLATTLLAGMGAGAVAAGLTSPLDLVKTRLQTQNMGRVGVSPSSIIEETSAMMKMKDCGIPSVHGTSCAAMTRPHYTGFQDALGSILKEEGYMGLWRGVAPRILTQAPAVAISWSFYECAKRWLAGDSIL